MKSPRIRSLIMNQELRGTQGVDRRHGVNGAFDSVWRIDPKTLEVEEGADLIDPTVRYWDYGSDSYTDTATAPFTQQFNRFCSGYLAAPGQLFNEKTGRGYDGQLYFANEENGDIGRLFGHGNPFDRAGLTNGHNFVVDMADEAVSSDTQFRATYGKNNPARFDLGSEEEVDWNQPGADQNAESKEDGLALNRIEDGAFDPRHPEDFYFVTTAGGNGATSDRDGGGIWRLSYDDVERPWEGGTLTLLLDGSESDPAQPVRTGVGHVHHPGRGVQRHHQRVALSGVEHVPVRRADPPGAPGRGQGRARSPDDAARAELEEGVRGRLSSLIPHGHLHHRR